MTAIRPAIRSPPSHLLALPNVTSSVPVIVMLYNDPLLCGFNVPNKEFSSNNSTLFTYA